MTLAFRCLPLSISRNPLRRSVRPLGAVLAGMTLAGLAHAQSSVTISGTVDVGVSKKTGGTMQLGTIGRSNLTFSGTEDLGGGLAATFKLSTRFELDTGELENSDAQRPYWKAESTVGLKGDFGAVRLGRALTPLWELSWAYDAWYNNDRIASPQWLGFAPDYLSNPQTREYSRLNNGVFYDTPKWNGFSAHVSAAVERGEDDLTRGVSGAVRYERGPFSAMLGLERNSQRDRVAFVGASYQFSQIKLMAGYSHVRLNRNGEIFGADWTNWAAASKPTAKRSALTLSGVYTVGASSFKLGFGRDFQGATDGFNYIASTFANAGTHYSGPITQISVGYSYALSKRTSLFADLSRAQWKFTDDQGRRSAMGYAVGMTHSF